MALSALNVNELPLVLAGPIVRRVESGATTVWVALKEARKVTLDVWGGETANGTPLDQKQTGTRITAKLGANLYAVAVTAVGGPLAPGTIYRYTLRFGPPTSPGTPVDASGPGLFTSDIVAASETLARRALLYTSTNGAPQLPSFITPPASAQALRLFHASCRKPHGYGRDALSILNRILSTDIVDPAKRPHQLLLTGDQIYADDVADVLLHLCTTQGNVLLGRTETVPDVPEAATALRTGRRAPAMKQWFKLSSSEAKSHLITFAEFACMYLMAWSPVLWPAAAELLSGWGVIYPDEAKSVGPGQRDVVRNADPPKNWSLADATWALFHGECKRLEIFLEDLPDVRRLMANTATYMMFDDHEVTDDWYIAERWMVGVIQSNSGKRLLTNALAAYAVFQAWGNTPERFDPGNVAGEAGVAILTALAAADPTTGSPADVLRTRLGIPTAVISGVPQRPAGAIDWHFNIAWTSHRLIVLDTRTRRRFPGGPDAPPSLIISDADYTAMIPEGTAPNIPTIVLSPAPVVGYPPIDQVVQPMIVANYESLLKNDGEAWSLQASAFEKLIARLLSAATPGPDGVRHSSAVVLSGDVHYGFSTRLDYVGSKPFSSPAGMADGVVAQLVSSAARNQDPAKTEKLHNLEALISDIAAHQYRAGWANLGGARQRVGTVFKIVRELPKREDYFVAGYPALARTDFPYSVTVEPEWRYTVDLLRDTDPESAPAPPGSIMPVAFPLRNRQQAIAQYVAAAGNHDTYHGLLGQGRVVVGFNNIGEVQFTWPATSGRSVTQTLWWRLGSALFGAPLTRVVVPLEPGLVDAPLYGGLDLREQDRDAPVGGTPIYAGTLRPDLAGQTHVRTLKRDLRELGIWLDPINDGVFSRHTRWAVRELQAYAKMSGIAREEPAPSTTLTSTLTTVATTISVAAAASGATPTLRRVRIDDEILEVTAGWGNTTMTVRRGAEGTTPAAHAANATVLYLDRWSARLRAVANPVRYKGPVSGVVNARTRAVIERWKRDRLRCPVVVEAWDTSGGARTGMHRATVSGTEQTAENIWRAEEVTASPAGPGNRAAADVFVRDLSTQWTRPGSRPADGPAENALSVLGTRYDAIDRHPNAPTGADRIVTGPYADALSAHTWSEAEVLPERLTGKTLAALEATTLSTFKIIRAVSEPIAGGYLDGLNAYDPAFLAAGLCHWTAGRRNWPAGSPKPPRDLLDVEDGELWAFLAYMRTYASDEFTRIAGHFGVGPDRRWVGDGKRGTPSPWNAIERKYVARGTETDESGAARLMNGLSPIYGQSGEHDYLRTWHWFHRFSMAARSSPGFWRAAWVMARVRLRDILEAEWNNPAVPSGSRYDLAAGTRVGDVFRSERTVALIYRWHTFAPGDVFEGTPGAASRRLHAVLRRANDTGPAFGTTPASWTTAHEQSLATAILAQNDCPNHPPTHAGHSDMVEPGHSLRIIANWPTWTAASNPRHFALNLSVLDASERVLKIARTTTAPFPFDRSGLP